VHLALLSCCQGRTRCLLLRLLLCVRQRHLRQNWLPLSLLLLVLRLQASCCFF
jgi:hypothetical protein